MSTNGHHARILNVGLVGIGEVAMTVHLPTLLHCSHMYKMVALCDISKEALAFCSSKYQIPTTYDDIGDMLAGSPEIDVVFILTANEYHVRHVTQSLKAGKHVMIEKPMAITLDGADEIEAARLESGKVVFVGYMRRYSEAFLRVKERVHALPKGDINYIRVRDLIGANHFFVDQSGTFPRKFTEFPASSMAERKQLRSQLLETGIGSKAGDARDQLSWDLLHGLSSHDISALRELVGMPKRVLKASRSKDGLFTFVMFEYDGFVVLYEVGIDNVQKFDAHIEVYAKDQHIKVSYDTPYIKGLPITATILSTTANGDASEEVLRPTYEDPYTGEYRALYAAIVDHANVKTGPLDARQDTEIFTMIMNAMDDIA